jgi:cytochrome c-type biogenesis protein CcmE
LQLRVIAGSILILLAMGTAAVFTYRSNQELYFSVDEFVAGRGHAVYAAALSGDDGADPRRVQIRGQVDYATVARPNEGLEIRFDLKGHDNVVPVVYRGVVPDTFEMAQTVTVAGRLDADGTFVADQLFVQCPSKYEAVPPGAEASQTGG